MSNRPSLDDYIDVAERIQHFKDQHPDGSLQTLDWNVVEVAGQNFIVYRAAAYRSPDDERPGHGIAWEPFPGRTPYTKDSELMNAETAAWGRAIVALGLASNRKIASRQEVQARSGDASPPPDNKPTGKQIGALKRLVRENNIGGVMLAQLLEQAGAHGVKVEAGWTDRISMRQASALIDLIKNPAPTGRSDIPSDAPADFPPDDLLERKPASALTGDLA